MIGSPWGEAGHAAWDPACSRCEFIVLVSEEHRRQLVPILMYDRRTAGKEGRHLMEPMQAARDP